MARGGVCVPLFFVSGPDDRVFFPIGSLNDFWQLSSHLVPLFGLLLSLYSMRLLWKLGQRDTPLNWADNCRCWAAFIFNCAVIALWLAFVFRLLAALYHSLA